MFDPVTAALIAASPPLSGLDLEGLPKRLAEAYAEIVTARILLRGQTGVETENLQSTLADMRRLAAAYEAHVALFPDRENRNSAAFVAASAHQACLLGNRGETQNFSKLEGDGVAAEVCAAILFLAADALPDAMECAKKIIVPEDRLERVDGALLNAIKLLCQGRLANVRDLVTPPLMEIESSERSVEALYRELLEGVKALASRLLTQTDLPPSEGGIAPAALFFKRVKGLSVGALGDVLQARSDTYSLFPGPLHLANLLLAADRYLIESAVTRTQPPNGVAQESWWPIIRNMARSRPFLWRNHRAAIESGYLEIGVSAAISFPTGGGKSTLAELKIATALLRGKKVVFLVPTHALVDQTTRALQKTFDTFNIVGDLEDDASVIEIIDLPAAIVTTPERCLMLLWAQPEAFIDLGLVVFDECHLLHPRDAERSRRSVDAMLAVLNLAAMAPEADFIFLSAMMKNAEEISGWLEALTGRKCLPLNVAWKPTRQVRGCVVYPSKRIDELKQSLTAARVERPTQKTVPASVVRSLKAQPFGFFSLLQTWATQERNDYALLPLLDEEHGLATGTAGKRWYLTPNGNKTAALIAASSASSGMKTLIFVQTIPLVTSAVSGFSDLVAPRSVELSKDELDLHSLASEEMGGPEHCFMAIGSEGKYAGSAIGHHSLLLREERLMHESLFKRPDGIDVLFATSTLAQGMNLPSEVVLIAGDSRFDDAANKLAQLDAHELLNAAGRAGRAGESSQGLVLVVPSKVVEFNDEDNLIGSHWMTLQSIFSQSDQCLIIDDALTALLDAVHAGVVEGMPSYLLSRLPPQDRDGSDDPLRKLIGSSLGAFRARANGDLAWIETRIDAAIEARKALAVSEGDVWLDRAAGLTGVSVATLRDIASLFEKDADKVTTLEAVDRLISWLSRNPQAMSEVLRPENVAGLFGGDYETLISDKERCDYALPVIERFLKLWMAGQPLSKIEAVYGLERTDLKHCKHARHFVLRLVSDLAFFAGLPALLINAKAGPEAEEVMPICVASMSSAIREGCDSPESLAVRIDLGRSVSRVAARQFFDQVKQFIPPQGPTETFEDILERVRHAAIMLELTNLD